MYQAFVDYIHPERGLERIDLGPVPPSETRHRNVTAEMPEDPRWEPSALMPRLYFSDASGNAWMDQHLHRRLERPLPPIPAIGAQGGAGVDGGCRRGSASREATCGGAEPSAPRGTQGLPRR